MRVVYSQTCILNESIAVLLMLIHKMLPDVCKGRELAVDVQTELCFGNQQKVSQFCLGICVRVKCCDLHLPLFAETRLDLENIFFSKPLQLNSLTEERLTVSSFRLQDTQ